MVRYTHQLGAAVKVCQRATRAHPYPTPADTPCKAPHTPYSRSVNLYYISPIILVNMRSLLYRAFYIAEYIYFIVEYIGFPLESNSQV